MSKPISAEQAATINKIADAFGLLLQELGRNNQAPLLKYKAFTAAKATCIKEIPSAKYQDALAAILAQIHIDSKSD